MIVFSPECGCMTVWMSSHEPPPIQLTAQGADAGRQSSRRVQRGCMLLILKRALHIYGLHMTVGGRRTDASPQPVVLSGVNYRTRLGSHVRLLDPTNEGTFTDNI